MRIHIRRLNANAIGVGVRRRRRRFLPVIGTAASLHFFADPRTCRIGAVSRVIVGAVWSSILRTHPLRRRPVSTAQMVAQFIPLHGPRRRGELGCLRVQREQRHTRIAGHGNRQTSEHR